MREKRGESERREQAFIEGHGRAEEMQASSGGTAGFYLELDRDRAEGLGRMTLTVDWRSMCTCVRDRWVGSRELG